jgi:SAM-dependent methyltransferase
MFSRFSHRSHELEHLDKGDYTPEEYEGCIVELQRVNRWLGDASALRRSLLKYVEEDGLREFSLLDVGAGSGELLRVVADWTEYTKRRAVLVGLEYNERSARAILEDSTGTISISSVLADAFMLPFRDGSFDYVMCSLFTHHFEDDRVIHILREMRRVARRRVVVIDLHRHPVAYLFYTTIGHVFLHNRLIREDGALSILRSFKPSELKGLGRAAGLDGLRVKRHFPYRLVLSSCRDGKARARNEREVSI